MGTEPARNSGLLLHLTSLPNKFGIGDLGPAAHRFVEDLAASGQRYWQMLPIGPTGYGNSPYQTASTFAGNPLLISPEALADMGLIAESEIAPLRRPNSTRVDYGDIIETKTPALFEAAVEFLRNAGPADRNRYSDFVGLHSDWIHDFALYTAIKQDRDSLPWTEWGPGLAGRQPKTINKASRRLGLASEIQRVLQFLFFEQWETLSRHAREAGVALVGDIPLYVAHDSADVWANRPYFQLDDAGLPTVVAGVPPDYFSETGQRWGNPIYDWKRMAEAGFPWWRARMRHALTLFDLVRVDHFRGIAGYWEIPVAEATAVHGRWCDGPGNALIDAIVEETSAASIIAEDLGVITEDVIALRDRYRLPGMRIAQFGFDTAPDSSTHHPDTYPVGVWAYTGTHDNDTTLGWFWQGNEEKNLQLLGSGRKELLASVGEDVSWGLMRLVAESKAMTAIYPVQDLLRLGSEARMNTPATTEGNWEWRLEGELDGSVLGALGALTEATGRLA